MLKTVKILIAMFSISFVCAQTDFLLINEDIKLPKNNTISKTLISSLNSFLLNVQNTTDNNPFVFEKEKIETLLLLEEMENIGKNDVFKDTNFYKPYLTNVVLLDTNDYLIQISYIGVKENRATLKAVFELIAHQTGDTFQFSSPLIKNTLEWKIKKVGNNVFHYKNKINHKNTEEFNELVSFYDSKLKPKNKRSDIYCSGNLQELLKLIGVIYLLDYNGKSRGNTSAILGDRKVSLIGNNLNFNEFDPHDLWHDRLSLVMPRNKVNRAVDEGCAYYYGGSWGLTWKEIFDAFKKQIVNQKPDWTVVKEKRMNFKTNGYNNAADYIVNALLIKKIENEKGFSGIWKLLNCGPYEKGNKRYYKTLQELTGITKETYNMNVWKLINNEK